MVKACASPALITAAPRKQPGDNIVGSVVGMEASLGICQLLSAWDVGPAHGAPPDRVGHWAGLWPWRRVGGLAIPATGE